MHSMFHIFTRCEHVKRKFSRICWTEKHGSFCNVQPIKRYTLYTVLICCRCGHEREDQFLPFPMSEHSVTRGDFKEFVPE